MFRLRRRRQPSVLSSKTPILPSAVSESTPIAVSSESRSESSCLTGIHLVLGALIPLMIGIATVVITVEQQKSETQRRNQELQIAQDNRKQDQWQADELYLQDVYKTYIHDVSAFLFKQQPNSSSAFIDKQSKLAYIRSQTLTVLEVLDAQRKSRIFLFLYENSLLPRIRSSIENESDISLVLSSANLANITLRNTRSTRPQFRRLSLPSVDLTNSSFVGCDFLNGTNFSGSDMNDINFTTSEFYCSNGYDRVDAPLQGSSTFFHDTTLMRANFRAALLCDTSFNESQMAYSNFSRARFWGTVKITGTDLKYADFSDSRLWAPVSITIINTNMIGARFDNGILTEQNIKTYFKMRNVILPNGTWKMDDHINVILNGNAEQNCSASDIPSWKRFDLKHAVYPNLSMNYNGVNRNSFGDCSFNLTVGVNKHRVAMYQDAVLKDFSLLIDTNETGYQLSADVMCSDGLLVFDVLYYDKDNVRLWSTKLEFKANETQIFKWHSISMTDHILATTRTVNIEITVQDGSCFVDNIKLRIRRRNAKK